MIITELTIPAEQFALYETLSTVPEMVVNVDGVVAHASTRIMPYFWIAGTDYEEFKEVAKNDPSVEELTANQKRVRFIGTDIHDYAKKAPAGFLIDSKTVKKVSLPPKRQSRTRKLWRASWSSSPILGKTMSN